MAIALVIALLPFAHLLDDRVDRTRPMYADRSALAWLEYQHVREHGTGLALTLSPGEHVVIAGRVFEASAGTTLTTRVLEQGYCVRAANDFGDATDWRCWDDDSDPQQSPGYAPERAPAP